MGGWVGGKAPAKPRASATVSGSSPLTRAHVGSGIALGGVRARSVHAAGAAAPSLAMVGASRPFTRGARAWLRQVVSRDLGYAQCEIGIIAIEDRPRRRKSCVGEEPTHQQVGLKPSRTRHHAGLAQQSPRRRRGHEIGIAEDVGVVEVAIAKQPLRINSEPGCCRDGCRREARSDL